MVDGGVVPVAGCRRKVRVQYVAYFLGLCLQCPFAFLSEHVHCVAGRGLFAFCIVCLLERFGFVFVR